ncbi:AMP-binding enzyme [Lentzea atacamensis]|uniref:AMP-binding enzyme n=2 Tax=Lentzea atacamensis TaxID=531938 RepID=A0A316HKZ7_9PSEU|nr:AMP-binding enzyme [Lentzea atacamensis]
MFVDEHGRDEETITAAALGEAAAAIGGALRGWGFQPGDRALLVHPPGADFVRALLGCLAAGVVPVPVYPPNPVRLGHDLAGFRSIVDSCRPRAVLTNSAYDRARTVGAVTGFFDRSNRSGRACARLDSSLPFSNRPSHTRLRKLMNRSFTPRAMAHRRYVVEETCRELLDGFTGGDSMTEVACPFPARSRCSARPTATRPSTPTPTLSTSPGSRRSRT